MPWDGAAYMAQRRVERLAQGLCESCGDPNENGGTTVKCRACRDDENRRARDVRKYARIGKAVVPQLRQAIRTGQAAWISPQRAKKLVEVLDRSDGRAKNGGTT